MMGESALGKRVLIVDDAIFMRQQLRDILTAGGLDVVGEATNGVEAVEMFRALRPDLVTMDIVMPLKSGIEATRDICREHPDAIVVMCSALGQETLAMEAIEAGATDFIVKDFKQFRQDEVLKVARNLLGITK